MSLELLSLGTSFLGGLLGRSSQEKQQSRQLAQSQKQFDAQMDTSVQRRVRDAKTAGIHPLFAMGASVGASPTISTGQGPQGTPMADAIGNMARQLGVIEQNRASAKKDEAEAALMDSERARIEQDLRSRGADSKPTSNGVQSVVTDEPIVEGPATYYSPEVPMSKSRGIVAGTQPGTIDVVVPDGRVVNIPSPDIGLDEVAQIDYVYQRAVHWTTDRINDWINTNRKLGSKGKALARKVVKFMKTPKGYQYQGDTGGDPTK